MQMIETVIKRDGRKVPFDEVKIEYAILMAMNKCGKCDVSLATKISEEIGSLKIDTITVEEIQDRVEKKLMASNRKDVAREYVRYRYRQELARNEYKNLMNAISEKLSANNVANQNANVDEKSFGGRIGEATNLVMKRYALDYCMSDMARNNHENNEVYIHDLDHYAIGSHNCLSVPFDKLLANGFNTRQTDVRPANSVNTAFQLVAVIFQLQSLQQFGGVSATHLDWTMVPYVRKSFYKHYKDGLEYIMGISEEENKKTILQKIRNVFYKNNIEEINNTLPIDSEIYTKNRRVYKYAEKMTIKETYQAVEGMYHNLNTLQSRSGNQLPFTSINYGTCTSKEGRLIIKALLDTSIKGIGKLHKTSIFPCGIFQVMSGVNKEKGTPNYDMFRLALKSTSQRLYPNYANVDWSGNAGYDKNDPKTYFSTMGKRKLQLI